MTSTQTTKQSHKKKTTPVAGTNGGAKGKAAQKRLKLAADVGMELRALRAAFGETLEHYRLSVEGRLHEALQTLEDPPLEGKRLHLPPAKDLENLLDKLKNVRVKPKKGRPKDLQRMRKLADRAAAIMPN